MLPAPMPTIVLVTSEEAQAVGAPLSGEKGMVLLIERFFSLADRRHLETLSHAVIRTVRALPAEGRFVTEGRWQELVARPRAR